MKRVKLTLKEFLALGGKIESLVDIYNTYSKKSVEKLSFSHTSLPSFGNPNGVHMYIADGKPIAEDWIEVYAFVVLSQNHK